MYKNQQKDRVQKSHLLQNVMNDISGRMNKYEKESDIAADHNDLKTSNQPIHESKKSQTQIQKEAAEVIHASVRNL